MQAEVQKQLDTRQVEAESHARDDRPDVVLHHRQANRAAIRGDHPQASPTRDRQAFLHPSHQVLIDLTEHQRTDLVTRLVEGLGGHLVNRVGAIAQVGEERVPTGRRRGHWRAASGGPLAG